MVAAAQVGCGMRAALLCVLLTALSAHASVYYVTVAGLGGEPDYEQRFTANAKDLDKLFKESGNGAHVYTLTGTPATRAQLTETLASVAHEAKPEDDFVLMLIGHGSFDGTDYKFNLVGPDITAAELAEPVRSHSRQAAADCQHDQRQRRIGGRSGKTRARRDRRYQERHGEKCYRVRALLGGGAAGPHCRRG